MDRDGSFDLMSDSDKDIVMRLVAPFHFRTGLNNTDGSMGSIHISPGRLRDILAYALSVKEGTNGS
jgi:hypothetical protein